MRHRRRRAEIGDAETGYVCVLKDGEWHLTQEQANPPQPVRGSGAFSSCCIWLPFTQGYDRRRPTCPECLRHVEVFEASLARTATAT